MPKQTLLLVLIFTLAACAQPSPAPTATPLPPTATLTPAPTSTPLPTLTPTPEFWRNAVSEYGMPEEEAQKLEELSGKVTFEKYDELVDGVVVQENGEDAFFYSFRYDALVKLADFERSSFDEDFARSVEMSAYIEYKLLAVEYDMDHYRSALKNVLQKLVAKGSISQEQAESMKNPPMTVFQSAITSIGYSPEMLKLFDGEGILPFIKDTGIMVELNSPDNGPFTEHRLTVVAFPNLKTGKLDFVKLKIRSNEEKIDKLVEKWKNNTEILIVSHYPSSYSNPDTTMDDTVEIFADTDMTIEDRINAFYFEQDISALAQPEIILPLNP